MLLFAASINWLLAEAKIKGYKLVAYADDIIIAYKVDS